MSLTVDTAFVRQYTDLVFMMAQQKKSRLAEAVTQDAVVGKSKEVERLGPATVSKRTSRHADVTYEDIEHSRRRLILEDYEGAILLDKQDELRMIIQPENKYAMSLAMGLGRKMDDVIIAAAVGNATAVDADETASNVAIAHTVDEDFTTANSDIIIEKILEAKRILDGNEVDEDDPRYFVYDAISQANLLNQDEVKSADYNTIRALVRGEIDTYLGFKFIRSERLTDSSEGFKQCLAFAKSGLVLGKGQDANVKLSELPTKGYATQIYASMSVGAVRVSEDHVVIVEAYRA